MSVLNTFFNFCRDKRISLTRKEMYRKMYNTLTSLPSNRKLKINKLNKYQIKEIKDYWFDLTGMKVDTRWHEMLYSMTGIYNVRYMPFEVYSELIDRMSPKKYRLTLNDKNLTKYLLKDFHQPQRIAECFNGVSFQCEPTLKEVTKETMLEFISNVDGCIIKPSRGSDGGRGVAPFATKNGIELNSNIEIGKFLEQYKDNFCIEKKIKECDNLSALNPSSCNTVRVHTFRDRNEGNIKLGSAYLRIGRRGKIVDNAHSGGICCPILNGGLLGKGVTPYPYVKHEITDEGITIEGYKIEDYDNIVSTAIRAHSSLPMFDVVGWDIAVDDIRNVVIIEFNPDPDMRLEQVIFNDTCLGALQETLVKQVFERTI